MIKLLALDLDGTLLNSRGEISERNLQAIRQAEEKGVLVTIATGRRFRDALPVALKINLNAPLISHNGALLKFADTLETMSVSLIPTETVYKILQAGNEFGTDAMMSCEPQTKGVLFYDKISENNIPLKRYIIWAERLHGEEAESSVVHVDSLTKIVEKVETIHISFSGNCQTMFEFERHLQNRLGNEVSILATIYPHLDFTLLDILPQNVSKASGLEKLAKLYQIQRETIMAIGDNYNDLDMLNYAGTAVVMGNSSAEMLAMEGFETTSSNENDGVAEAIENYILK